MGHELSQSILQPRLCIEYITPLLGENKLYDMMGEDLGHTTIRVLVHDIVRACIVNELMHIPSFH